MHKIISLMLFAASLLPLTSAYAVNDDFRAKVNSLESSITQDQEILNHAKGEMISITEFRIGEKTRELEKLLGKAIEQPEGNHDYLQQLVEHQLEYAQKSQAFLQADIARLKSTLGTDQDASILMAIAKRESQVDSNYKTELKLLDWGTKLGLQADERRAVLKTKIAERGDRLASVVKYTHEQLQKAVDAARTAGKDVTAEQTAKVNELKTRLDQNSSSLSTTIGMLDELKGQTAAYKQIQFEVSGDITQDVLDINVVSKLLGRWLGAAEAQTVENGPKLMFKAFIFFLILFGASLVAKVIKRIVKTAVSNSKLNFSKLLQDFFISLSEKGVYSIGVLIALSQLGFELGPLLAGFGIAGVIVGFALQDTLSNFASGMMILIYRPYDVGDLITAGGVTGTVSHMSLVSTTIKTLDNQRLIIPNNKIWGDTINNITAEHQRRVDMVFGISYSDNVDHAEALLIDIVTSHPKVLKNPGYTIKLHKLGESSVDFIVRPWVSPGDYWDVYWDITKEVKKRFDAEGITIPFPQRDVHFYRG